MPFAVLPLHVFEPRYRVLIFDCLRGDREFGVVLIERGSEVGGADQRFAVATVARIIEASELPDGRWVLFAVGTRRIEVAEWLADDPYPVALTEPRHESPWSEAAATALAQVEAPVRRALELSAEVGEDAASPLVELSDEPAVAAWQLLAVAPVSSLDKQRLLGIDDPPERLRQLAQLADDQAALLTYRLKRG